MPEVITVWLDTRARALIAHETEKRPRTETGGALFGYESDDEIVVACAYGPGPRARHRRTSFDPDPRTTAALIAAVRTSSDQRYRYLGSWHSHPSGMARPSAQDLRTTEVVAAQPDVLLPRPLVLIQSAHAGSTKHPFAELRAWRWEPNWTWLMPCGIETVELEECWCPTVTLRPRRRQPTTMSPGL